jgi:hypothetical protein
MAVFIGCSASWLVIAQSAQEPQPTSAGKLALIKPAPTSASTFPWLPDYLRVLERFPAGHSRNWHELPSAAGTLGYFGTGDRSGALMQSRALLAMAYLAAEAGYDARASGVPLATVRGQALQSLRHLLHTHTTGDVDRIGGGRWGGDAAAASVVPPLAAASRLLEAQLTPSDVAAMERVLAAEANRLLEQSPAAGRPRGSRAVENAAAGECLAWAAALMPDRPEAPRWEYQVRLFATNTLSTPQDRSSDAAVDSRPLREWVTTENLLADHALESGGAVNPDAALRALACLSNAYYAYIGRGRPVPAALTHHFEDVWGAVQRLWLGGHRFARPAGSLDAPGTGGDLALFPVAALLQWVGSEPSVARLIERGRFQALEAEQVAHADGSFFAGRAGLDAEAEAAASLTMAALIHRRHGTLTVPAGAEPLRAQLAGTWTSPSAGLAASRSRNCFASWCWRSVGHPLAPVGLFVPMDSEEVVGWGPDQLVGSFELQGFTEARTLHHRERTIEGGFTVTGQIEEGLKEGRPGLHHFVAFAALPASRFAVGFDLAIAAEGVTVTRNEGLQLRLPRDPATGNRHTIKCDEGVLSWESAEPGKPMTDRPISSSWLNVEDHLGIISLYSQGPLTLRDGSTSEVSKASELTDRVDTPLATQPVAYQTGQIVRDTVILLLATDAATTSRLAPVGAVLPTGSELIRAAVVPTVEGGRYLVAANFGLKETKVTLRPPGSPPLNDLRLPPLDTLVLELGK